MRVTASLNLTATVQTIAFSPDGTRLVAGAGFEIVEIDARSGRVTARAQRESRVDAMAYSGDGSRIAVAMRDERVLIISSGSLEATVSRKSPKSGYHELEWAPGAELVVAGHYEPWVVLFDLAKSKQYLLDPGVFDDEGRTAVSFSVDGRLFASTASNRLLIWRVADVVKGSGKTKPFKRLALRGETRFVDVCFTGEGGTVIGLALGKSQSTCHVWALPSGAKRETLRLPTRSTRLVTAVSSRLVAIAGDADGGTVSLWTTDLKLVEAAVPVAEGTTVSALAMSRNGGALAAGTDEGNLMAWSLEETGAAA